MLKPNSRYDWGEVERARGALAQVRENSYWQTICTRNTDTEAQIIRYITYMEQSNSK